MVHPFPNIYNWLKKLFARKSTSKKLPVFENTESNKQAVSCTLQINQILFQTLQNAGKAYRKRFPSIRVIQVNSFADAYCFFLDLCDPKQIKYKHVAGYLYYKVDLPKQSGTLILTDKTKKRPSGMIALLQLNIQGENNSISEIRFIQIQPYIK